MSDPGFGHDRNTDCGDDAVDQIRITHPRHATLGADVRGHAFQRHYRHRTGSLGDARLLRVDDVHDHAALEHLGHPALDSRGSDLGVIRRAVR